MKKLYTILLAFVLATISSCTYEFPETPALIPGSANFSKVVAVGNSLTAGFMNGALYNQGQETSYANIVAQQMKDNGGGEFNQPDIDAENGIILSFLPAVLGRLILKGELTPQGVINPAPAPIGAGDPLADYAGDKAALNNFGVPGMRIVDATFSGYAPANPYFGRFASSLSATVLGDAIAANGSFIMFWLGNNDVLGYASGGATGGDMGNGSNPADMTDPAVFDVAYRSTVAALITNDSKQGIIANIPNVQDIPHFTTVPWDAIEFDTSDPVDSGTVAALNAGYAAYNDGLDFIVSLDVGFTQEEADFRKIVFADGENGIVIFDNSLTDLTGYDPALVNMRMTNSTDLITLLAGALLPTGVGVSSPLGEEYTLIEADQVAIADRIVAFNSTIKSVVDGSGGSIALLDINEIFSDFAAAGTKINGSDLTSSIFPPLGAFSLDGVHPNPRGAAYIATLFIDKINEAFGSNIPNVNPNNYPGNELPQPQ